MTLEEFMGKLHSLPYQYKDELVRKMQVRVRLSDWDPDVVNVKVFDCEEPGYPCIVITTIDGE